VIVVDQQDVASAADRRLNWRNGPVDALPGLWPRVGWAEVDEVEECDGLRRSVFKNLKVLASQVFDESSFVVNNANEYSNEFYLASKGCA
jgi:hypothetical protein